MSDPLEEARRVWQAATVTATITSAVVSRWISERRRRDRRFWASAAIIVPSWVVTLWLYPDLQPMALAGLFVAAILCWQVYRRRATVPMGAQVACVDFERTMLLRQRNHYQTMPLWYGIPILVGQVAIALTILLNPRFGKNQALLSAALALFAGSVIAVLAVAYRRTRRIIAEIDREIALLPKGADI
jgi:hypothetical protein